jgi:hypothetical protein
MGQNLKKVVDKHFDINKNVYGRIELYNEIIKAKEGTLKHKQEDAGTDDGNS